MRLMLLGALAIAIMSILPVKAQVPGNYRIYGAGTSSCGTWTQDKQKHDTNGDSLGYFQGLGWLDGFVTGAGYAGPGLRRTDAAGMEAFMNSYCQAHPLETMATAAEALVRELQGRPK